MSVLYKDNKDNNKNENLESEEQDNNVNKDPHYGMPNYVPAPEKEESKFHKIFFSNKGRYVVALIVSIVLFIALSLVFGFKIFQSYVDASFVVAIVDLGFAGLSVATREGTFDGLSYGFYKIFVSYRFNNPKGKYNDLYDYKMVHDAKRKDNPYKFVPYIVVGLVFLIISLILFSILQAKIAKSLS